MRVKTGLPLWEVKINNIMKKFALVQNNEVIQVGGLPTNWKNISNFYLMENDLEFLQDNSWLPVETITENKSVYVSTEYIIEEKKVKEVVTTREKTLEEIDIENKLTLDAKMHSLRFLRDKLLKESDIFIVADKWEKMDPVEKEKWSNYRQQLRDIPQNISNPDEVVWPIIP
jgi:hypothetical protein